MQAGDIIQIRTRTNVDTVQCSNTMYLHVDSAAGAMTINQNLTEVVTQWWNTYKDYLKTSVVLACATWNNLTRNEKGVAYPGLAGMGAGDHHPSQSVIALHAEGWTTGDAPPRTIAKFRQSLSGFREELSTRGRADITVDLTAYHNFFLNIIDMGVGESKFRARARHDSAGKAWRDGGKVGPQPTPVYEYHDIQTALTNKQFRTLVSRRPRLCA